MLLYDPVDSRPTLRTRSPGCCGSREAWREPGLLLRMVPTCQQVRRGKNGWRTLARPRHYLPDIDCRIPLVAKGRFFLDLPVVRRRPKARPRINLQKLEGPYRAAFGNVCAGGKVACSMDVFRCDPGRTSDVRCSGLISADCGPLACWSD